MKPLPLNRRNLSASNALHGEDRSWRTPLSDWLLYGGLIVVLVMVGWVLVAR